MADKPNKMLHILVIDDSSADTLITSKLIERQKPENVSVVISTASRLDEAQPILQSENIDCVLLDLHLPDGRGLGNIPIVRSLAPEVAIIIVSGSTRELTKADARANGADDYMEKQPLSRSGDLYSVISDALIKRQVI